MGRTRPAHPAPARRFRRSRQQGGVVAALPFRRKRNPLAAEDALAGWIFIAPALIVLSVFIFWPILQVFWISFHEWSVIEPEKPWRGLSNYRDIFNDSDFTI